MARLIVALFVLAALLAQMPVLSGAASAQESGSAEAVDRSATGGAQTLEDILRRQRGEAVDDRFRREETGDPNSAPPLSSQLGTLGGASDPDLWRALRYGSADVTVSTDNPAAKVLIQDGGMRWLKWRKGPLLTLGSLLLAAMVLFLLVFYLLRGRIKIEGKKTGRTVTRFNPVERFGHWLLAGSFILLALTGLISLSGRFVLIPLFGKDAFSTLAIGSKWLHNNVSWAFMLGLVLVSVLWIVHNLPDRTDLNWLAKGGGILSKHSHPPARKFNAGQKLIFWSVVLLGLSVSASGLSLLFPFDLPLFAGTFEKLNALGISGLFGLGHLPEQLAPQEEMQFAQIWHGIVAFIMMAIIIAHIYIGTIGMEGAFEAMGTGEVEEQWAREHHSLWLEEVREAEAREAGKVLRKAQPAE
ncbi:MAG: formate dehydrogenase subunit gamma [Nitratireductor sp.]|nr:formate dehydrogenase subunit gamma [Nitratireductor sp.]